MPSLQLSKITGFLEGVIRKKISALKENQKESFELFIIESGKRNNKNPVKYWVRQIQAEWKIKLEVRKS